MERSKRSMCLAGAVLVLAGLLAGCDSVEPPRHRPEVVVESYQVAGEALQPVLVSRTAAINTPYNFEALAVPDARVAVHLLADGGGVERTFAYRPAAGRRGVYVPVVPHQVLPLRRYRLEVVTPDTGERVTAETLVPGTFEVAAVNRDTVVYQGTEQFEVVVTPSRYPGRQSYYILTVEALDPGIDQLTPFYRDIVDPDDDGDEDELDEYRVVESPIINEDSFDLDAGGAVKVRLPWLAVAFFGPNRVTVSTLDDNLYDFVRSQAVQQGGSTLSPGEIPNVIEHVEGGRGLFGSLARTTFDVFIARPPAARSAR